jgi:hypothetical protein
MDTPWTALLGPTLWTIVQTLRSMAGRREGHWAACETTEQELSQLVGFATRKPISAALRHPLAPLFVRVQHRAERRHGRPVRLPSVYWVLAEDPPQECAAAVLGGRDPSAVLSGLGLDPPAPPPGYRRSARPGRSRQLPVVGVVRGAGRRAEMSRQGTFRPGQETAQAAAAAGGGSPEMHPQGSFQSPPGAQEHEATGGAGKVHGGNISGRNPEKAPQGAQSCCSSSS